MTKMSELTKALRSANLVGRELQDALETADAVEALVLLPLISDAAKLAQAVSVLIQAMVDCGS